MKATTAEIQEEALQIVDKSDLAGLISSAERLAEHFEQETTSLDLLVSGLAGESMPDAETMKQPHGHSLATLSDSQDRMNQAHTRMVSLIDRLNSLVAL